MVLNQDLRLDLIVFVEGVTHNSYNHVQKMDMKKEGSYVIQPC
jgi:hypothetical protein